MISLPGKLCKYNSLFSALVPKLQAVSCLRSLFDEADTVLPSSSCLLSEQPMSVLEGTKIAENALASHSQVAGSDEVPEKRIVEPDVQLQELQAPIY